MYHTIIVEDDPMVCAINRQYLASMLQFKLEATFSNGHDALLWLSEHQTDLAIVDYYMPVMNGAEFLRACHGSGFRFGTIMITAADSAAEITESLSLGVLDYIVKPFTFDRFQQALQKYIQIADLARQTGTTLSQEEIDHLTAPAGSSLSSAAALAKGIQAKTLDTVRAYMRAHAGEYLTCEEIAKDTDLSRITIRRYVNYMLENHEISSRMDYSTGGRPSIRYCIRNDS